jgi:hypothetical protein
MVRSRVGAEFSRIADGEIVEEWTEGPGEQLQWVG